ncbi:MAG: RNA 2',3'-cyclic phosphodiesterase [Chloroflexi bacterium]|nr:RNA 2',3'-cyclic phosphodiesterase [Chloroflexota bacterium]
MAGEVIRSFIAIELPGVLVKQLKDFQAGLRSPRMHAAKWVDPGSMHLTLKFLGNVDMKNLAAVEDETGIAVRSSQRFHLLTGQTGFFPDPGRPRVFWLGLEGDIEALVALHKAIDDSLSKLGYASENRPFTAHLTLARLREESGVNDRMDFARSVQGQAFKPPCNIEVNSIALMRSQLTPRGAVYTRLAEFALHDN